MGKGNFLKKNQQAPKKGTPFNRSSKQAKVNKSATSSSKTMPNTTKDESDEDDGFNQSIAIDFDDNYEHKLEQNEEEKARKEIGLTIAPKKTAPVIVDDLPEASSEEDNDEELEVYDWEMKSQKEEEQAKALEYAKDLEFKKLCEANAKREAERRERIKQRQEKTKLIKRLKKRKRCLDQNLAIRPGYNPYNF